jgi:hypothetical protein
MIINAVFSVIQLGADWLTPTDKLKKDLTELCEEMSELSWSPTISTAPYCARRRQLEGIIRTRAAMASAFQR